MRYHWADHKTQAKILGNFFRRMAERGVMSPFHAQEAFRVSLASMAKRMEKTAGLDNKYTGKGERREP